MDRARVAHICVDVQAMFAAGTDWHAPWLNRVLPAIEALVERDPGRTVFTRFVPPDRPEDAGGAWQDYYRRWPDMTAARLPAEMLEVVPTLRRYIPPARQLDKSVYSPWLQTTLHRRLGAEGIGTLVVSGGETDVCVLSTVLGAIDLGYQVILPTDAVFGSADQTHEAALVLYRSRFGQQLKASTTQEILDNWTELA